MTGLLLVVIGLAGGAYVWHRCGELRRRLPRSPRLRRRLARGWTVPGLDMTLGLPLPPGFAARSTPTGYEVLADLRLVPEAGQLAEQLTQWARTFEDAEAEAWAILQACWHFWAREGDVFALPLPPGWRLRPGLDHRAHLITGGGLELRDVAYHEGLAGAWHFAWLMMRWHLLLTWMAAVSCVLSGFVVGQGLRMLGGG